MNSSTEPPFPETLRVLVVDDDPSAVIFLEGLLQRAGWVVRCAASVDEAIGIFEREQLANFSCLITDCLMPGKTGIELLRWVQERDATMGTVMITAGTERQLVADSLRNGACDFLEKPVSFEQLRQAAARAAEVTRERRRAAASQSAVKDVADYQHRQQLAEAGAAGSFPLEVCFYPRSEAGGDFLTHFEIGKNLTVFLLTDVSGHDLKAAFLSAYFQGMVRGMMESKVSVEEIFRRFNRVLLEETRHGDATPSAVSVAACAVVFEKTFGRVEVLSCGSPLPVQVDRNGLPEQLGDEGGYPLGWFEENPLRPNWSALPRDGGIFVWTDGIEAHALEHGVSPVAMASAFLLAQRGLREPLNIQRAADDILAARIGVLPESKDDFLPLVVRSYPGNRGGEIDELQASWERDLRFCLPQLSADTCYAVLLATREAMLNALQHGCAGDGKCVARLGIAYQAATGTIRVFVRDPGPGHDFDSDIHESVAADELIAAHRGLILMRHLSDKLEVGRSGARLSMDFSLNRSWS